MSKSILLLALLLLPLVVPVAPAAPAVPAAPVVSGPEGRPFILYAKFTMDTEVDLSDGSRWSMDAGDCFPIYMFKDQRTKVILQLGSATFITDADRLKVLTEGDSPSALISYRRNLENFLKTKSDNWKRAAK